jgi:hypothetical protein
MICPSCKAGPCLVNVIVESSHEGILEETATSDSDLGTNEGDIVMNALTEQINEVLKGVECQACGFSFPLMGIKLWDFVDTLE